MSDPGRPIWTHERGLDDLGLPRASLSDYRATVAWIANAALRLASADYRALVAAALGNGMREMLREQSPNPPFTEPMDDPE